MSKRILKLTERDYKHIREFLIPIIDSYENTEDLTIIMNNNTKDKIEYILEAPIFNYLFGVKVEIVNIKNDVVLLNYNDSVNKYVKKDIINTRYLMNSLYGWYGGFTKENPTLPDRYIVNKNAAILFYGNNKTIVKRAKGDKIDPVKAFLWAYFLRNTGMTRTKANKYLHKVWNSFLEKVYNMK